MLDSDGRNLRFCDDVLVHGEAGDALFGKTTNIWAS